MPKNAHRSASESESLLREPEGWSPADGFRLPLEWSRRRAAGLLDAVDPDRRTSVLLVDPWNIVYYTGLWALSTERLLAAVLPADGGAPVWFSPYLDHDLVSTWWFGDGECYFDVPDSPHGSPYDGTAIAAPGVSQRQWLADHLVRRGFLRLVADTRLPDAALTALSRRGAEPPASIGALCLRQRMRKTPEELALATRAYRYFDEVHAWARDRLLERDPDLTDSRLRRQMTGWVTDRVMADLGEDRSPHVSAGRTGGEVAQDVHRFQIAQGVQEHIATRPARTIASSYAANCRRSVANRPRPASSSTR